MFLVACLKATSSPSGPTITFPAATVTPSTKSSPTPNLRPTLASTPQGTWISLIPDSGIPGDTIRIEGYLPGGLSQTDLASQNYTTYASICWNGCKDGLEEDGIEVTWSQGNPGHFNLKYIVPPIPWLALDGFHALDAGDYSVDLINLDPSKIGCASTEGCLQVPVASATFHLTQSAPYPPCQEQYCGSLVASPAEAAPGDRVQVKGWAPLVQFVGGPFGYNLVLEKQGNTSAQDVMFLAVEQNEAVQQAMDGSLTASFLVPRYGNDGLALDPGTYTLALEAPLTRGPDAFPILVAPTPLKITAAPAWSQVLPHVSPVWFQLSANLSTSTMAQDPLKPDRLAYCAPGEIQISADSGQSWKASPVSVSGLRSPGDRLIVGEDQPTCVSVTFDSSHPGTLYAVFDLVDKEYGAPPIYYAGYFTTDLGKTWQIAPAPFLDTSQAFINDTFGGFWTDGKTVQVLYYGKPGEENQPYPLLAKQTVDSGLTWTDAPLACPSIGACARWDAAPGMRGGMGAELPQSVLTSPDGGTTWQDTGQSIELHMMGPHELVSLSSTELILISGTHRFPLRYSSDGGMTWQVLSLPALPDNQSGYFSGFPSLQMLSDGSLLAMRSDTGQWMRLTPDAQDWCPTSLSSPNTWSVLLRFTGTRAWWFSNATMQPESVLQSELACQK